MKVFVYRNLHTGKWSVKALEGAFKGKVIAHVEAIEILGAELKVSEAGRQRVLREKRKNVHAGVAGWVSYVHGADYRYPVQLREELPMEASSGKAYLGHVQIGLTYNPYKYTSFVDLDTGEPIYHSKRVVLDTDGRAYAARTIGQTRKLVA